VKAKATRPDPQHKKVRRAATHQEGVAGHKDEAAEGETTEDGATEAGEEMELEAQSHRLFLVTPMA
jgi:hypothetical protein